MTVTAVVAIDYPGIILEDMCKTHDHKLLPTNSSWFATGTMHVSLSTMDCQTTITYLVVFRRPTRPSTNRCIGNKLYNVCVGNNPENGSAVPLNTGVR